MVERAVVQLFRGAGKPFQLERVDLPSELEVGEILVQISLATICGSDLHTFTGRRDAPTPCVLGHEAVGVVLSSRRPGVVPGDRITWTLADACGHCTACTDWNLPQKCERLFKYGHAAFADNHGLNGCYASHIVIRPGTVAFVVPEGLSDTVAAPANCALATIINALEQLPKRCDRVLIQGGGLLGIYACAWLAQQGIAEVYCVDLSATRLAQVAQFGGIPLRTDQTPPTVDLVLEVAGTSAVIPQGIEALRPGGHYIWAGMVHPETALQLTGEAVVRKCLTVRGVHNYAAPHLQVGLEFLLANQDRFPFQQLTSPPMPLGQLDAAFKRSAQQKWQRVAVQP